MLVLLPVGLWVLTLRAVVIEVGQEDGRDEAVKVSRGVA